MKSNIKHPNIGWKYFHGALILFAAAFFIMAIMAIIAIVKSSQLTCIDEGTKSLLSDYEFWFSGVYACLTLWIISYNLMKFIDVETVKALSDLRSKLNEGGNRSVHSYLMPSEDKKGIFGTKVNSKTNEEEEPCSGRTVPDSINVFNYLGTIELGAIMLQREVISFEEFYNQFGYRVINIANNERLMNSIRFEPEKQYYDSLWYVINEFQKRKLL